MSKFNWLVIYQENIEDPPNIHQTYVRGISIKDAIDAAHKWKDAEQRTILAVINEEIEEAL